MQFYILRKLEYAIIVSEKIAILVILTTRKNILKTPMTLVRS